MKNLNRHLFNLIFCEIFGKFDHFRLCNVTILVPVIEFEGHLSLVLAGLVERRRDDEWLNEWRLTPDGFEAVKVIDRFAVVAYANTRIS